uniref:TPR_REGION domain-containing protein n=1 Tax=Heterorhabditis bacteriophora TaxID=37862 RepID=A0A1I7X2Y7_HETBA
MDLSSVRTPDLTTSRLSVFRRNRSAFACTPLASVKIEDDEMNSSSPEYSYTVQDDSQNIEETIQRYIDVGDFTTATYWIDTSYAKKCENDRNVHVVKLACSKYLYYYDVHIKNYVETGNIFVLKVDYMGISLGFHVFKALTVVREWMRITTLIENNHLVHRHLVFAYYYVNSLFHRKMYTEIIQAPIGGLMDQKNLPVRYPQTTGGFDFFYDSFNQPILGEDLAALDKIAHEMRMFSATMLVYGRTYLLLENREMATQCLTLALFHASWRS